MPRRKTHKEFCDEIDNKFPNTYEILNKYKGVKTKVKVKHKICNYI